MTASLCPPADAAREELVAASPGLFASNRAGNRNGLIRARRKNGPGAPGGWLCRETLGGAWSAPAAAGRRRRRRRRHHLYRLGLICPRLRMPGQELVLTVASTGLRARFKLQTCRLTGGRPDCSLPRIRSRSVPALRQRLPAAPGRRHAAGRGDAPGPIGRKPADGLSGRQERG